jgi:1-acyl-sn-glycerol-3-phosphate acyltransferase
VNDSSLVPSDDGTATACGRDPLVQAITTFLAHEHAASIPEIRASLERALDDAGPEAIAFLGERLARTGADWSYYPGDPLARRIHHVLAGPVLRQDPAVIGIGHLAAVAGKPVVILANHLSYSDANLLDVVFDRMGGRDVSDRLTVVAGPKVYSNVRRRFSSLCFGTIKIPQNSERSSGEAVMNVREAARAARRSIEIAHERLSMGEALLVFPEGTRSRSATMQRMLSGVARYLDAPGTWILPVGIAGTEKLFPIAEESLKPGPITVRIGRACAADLLQQRAGGRRELMMDCIGFAIAALVPREYRGVYGEDAPADLRGALALAREVWI